MDTYARRVYRTRIRDFTGGVKYPATRAAVLAYARDHNTPSDIFNDLTHVTPDHFASVEEVIAAVETLHSARTA